MQSKEIVIIDGNNKPDDLVDQLGEAGYRSHHVRGPLKLHELVADLDIGLILWRDAAINPALGTDLFQVIKRHPAIPIIHLYAQKSAASSLPPGMVAARALPDATPRTQLINILASAMGTGEEIAHAKEIAHTELAFRHIFSRLSNSPPAPPSETPDLQQRGGFLPAGTALNPSERKLLIRRPEQDPTRTEALTTSTLLSRVTKRISAFKSR